MSPTLEAVARRVIQEVWNEARFELLSKVLPHEIPLHVNGVTISTSTSHLRDAVTRWHHGLSGFGFDIHEVVAQGDLVAMRLTLLGRHTEEFAGYAPTGNEVSVEHMFLMRFEENHLAEIWEVFDKTTLDSQLTGS